MAWKDISSTVVKYKDSYGSYPSGLTAVCLQYDDSSETPEAVKVRFKYYRHDGGTANLHDSMYILYNANDSSSSIGNKGRTLFLLKKYTGDVNSINWPFYSESFTIKKTYSSENFSLQDFWICNNGQNAVSATASNFYNSSRFNDGYLSCKQASSTFTVSNTVATAVSAGTVTITDHYNNTFSVSGTKGAAGDHNPSTGPTISWGYTTSYENSGAVSKKALVMTNAANASRTVYAKCITGATYGTDKIVTGSKAIKQYVAPKAPGIPKISFNKSRLTVKEPWTFSWTPAVASNTTSPVVGYRIRLYKNDKLIVGLVNGKDNKITLNTSASNTWLDRDSSANLLTFDPVALGFKAGDTVKLGIYAYTRYGEHNTGAQLFDSSASEKLSSVYTVKNAGIVNVKVGNTWKEGQVYVNIGGTWKEAETVSTNVAGVWKESQ